MTKAQWYMLILKWERVYKTQGNYKELGNMRDFWKEDLPLLKQKYLEKKTEVKED